MIIFDLCCDKDHRFEGWFRSADDFQAQAAQGVILCPVCESHQVRRVPSAVAIGGNKPSESTIPTSSGSASSATSVAVSDSQIMGVYRQMMQSILANTEDVGARFAEEARKIHYKEVPERSIRGQTTAEERETLREEGIEVLQLPVVNKEDLN